MVPTIFRYENVVTPEAKAAKEAALLAAAEAKKLGPQPLEVDLAQRAYAVAAAAVLAVAWGHATDEALVRQLLNPQVWAWKLRNQFLSTFACLLTLLAELLNIVR